MADEQEQKDERYGREFYPGVAMGALYAHEEVLSAEVLSAEPEAPAEAEAEAEAEAVEAEEELSTRHSALSTNKKGK